MKPIEINPVARNRAIGVESARNFSKPANTAATSVSSSKEPSMVSRSDVLSAGSEPLVNAERVAEIRNAIKEGTYPLNPAKVADAMIAADYILIEGTKD